MAKSSRGGRGGNGGNSRGRGRGRGGGGGGRGRGNNRGGGGRSHDDLRFGNRTRQSEEPSDAAWREVLKSVVPVRSMMDEARHTGIGRTRSSRVNWRISSIKFVSAGLLDTSLKIKDIKTAKSLQNPQAPTPALSKPDAEPLQEALEARPTEKRPASSRGKEPLPSTVIKDLPATSTDAERKETSVRQRSVSAASASSGDEILFGGRTNGIATPRDPFSRSPTRPPPKSEPPGDYLLDHSQKSTVLKDHHSGLPSEPETAQAPPVQSDRGGRKKSRTNRRRAKVARAEQRIVDSLLDPGVSNISLEPRMHRKLHGHDSNESEDDPALADYLENLMAQSSDSEDELDRVVRQTENIHISRNTHVIASGSGGIEEPLTELQTNILEEDNNTDEDPADLGGYGSSGDSVGTVEQAAMDLQDAFDHAEDDGALYELTAERMTDEQIAMRLAKQEELGLGSTGLLLVSGNDDFHIDDDMELGDLELQAQNYSQMAKGKGKSRSKLSAKSAFMDSLADEDPYSNFDVMDRERPSIRTSAKSKNKKPQLWLSDSELEREIIEAWENDKSAKRQRREERERRRAEGLLGKNGKVDKAVKYRDGFTFDLLREQFREFLDSEKEEHSLPPMDKRQRMVVHEISNKFGIKTVSHGSGDSRFTILYRGRKTLDWSATMWIRIEPRYQGRFNGMSNRGAASGKKIGGGGGSSKAATYREGEIVGAAAPELGTDNIGHAMLERMGWSRGTALGALTNKGILQPVEHVVKTSKIGLG